MKIDTFRVRLQFLNEVIAGCPAMPEDEEKARARTRAWVSKQLGDEAPEDLIEKAMEDIPEGSGTVFKRYEGMPVLETRQVKAMIRESAQRLGLLMGGKGRPGRQHVQHDIEVVGDISRFYIGLGVDEPQAGERPIHPMTPLGPRSDIKCFEYVDQPEIEFTVRVLNGVVKDALNESHLEEILDAAGCFMGLGADRSQGFGRFEIKEVSSV